MKSYKQKFFIYAGMPFNNPSDVKIKKVGYYLVSFKYNREGQLISQTETKRVFYK